MNIVLSENIQNNVDKTKHAPHDSCAAGGAKNKELFVQRLTYSSCQQHALYVITFY